MFFQFGKYKHKSIEDVFKDDVQYCKWVFKQPMLKDTSPEIYDYLKEKLINKNDYYMSFGKYRNKPLSWILQNDKKYIYWLKGNQYVQEHCQKLSTIVNGIII